MEGNTCLIERRLAIAINQRESLKLIEEKRENKFLNRPALFPDAKMREDLVQDLVGHHFSGNLSQPGDPFF